MENKHFGFIMLGISGIIIVIIFLYQNALKRIITLSCGEHGISCPMNTIVNQQTYFAITIAGLVVIMGLALIFTKPTEKIIIKKVIEKKKKKVVDLNSFRDDEKEVFNKIQKEGAVFQANLIEETGFGKAKITRILDKLEGHGLIERKRRGLTNVIVLKF